MDGITDQHGEVSLDAFVGKHVVLYWYPKDDTPGCTIEACNFRDNLGSIDAEILGVSLDDAASHQDFIAKFDLPFRLLVDPDGQLGKLYGAIIPSAPTRAECHFSSTSRCYQQVWARLIPKSTGKNQAAINR